MAEMMKAAVAHEFDAPLRIEEVLIPTPGSWKRKDEEWRAPT